MDKLPLKYAGWISFLLWIFIQFYLSPNHSTYVPQIAKSETGINISLPTNMEDEFGGSIVLPPEKEMEIFEESK